MFVFFEKVTGENILRKYHTRIILFFYKNSFNSLVDVFYFFLPKLRPFLIS